MHSRTRAQSERVARAQRGRAAHARPVCAAPGPPLFSVPSRRSGGHWEAAGLSSGGWILRIFSPNPPTRPSAGSRPRTPITGDASYFHVPSAGAAAGPAPSLLLQDWGREVAWGAGAWSRGSEGEGGARGTLGCGAVGRGRPAGRSPRCGGPGGARGVRTLPFLSAVRNRRCPLSTCELRENSGLVLFLTDTC